MAHAIQGLVKYHGLRNERLRLPYHDSISACVEALTTHATIEFDTARDRDSAEVNDRPAEPREMERILAVVEPIRRRAKIKARFRLLTKNSLREGKGLGFSASAFAAIGAAATSALGLESNGRWLSEVVRLGAGSATRSLAGGISVWYANRGGRSYAEQLASPEDLDFGISIVPVPAEIKTDMVHKDSTSSPLFAARLRYLPSILRAMRAAIRARDVKTIFDLAEMDTLNLHAVTMTGTSRLILMSPQTLRVISTVLDLRKEGVPVWYSMDTGPSVFVNTFQSRVAEAARAIRAEVGLDVIETRVADSAQKSDQHLF